ncbi:MAG: hypothetical protein U0133_07570 [Gemmatimonadales bacterium]
MTSIRRFLVLSILSFGLGGTVALVHPSTAEAEKLPVDCSGRFSTCTTIRSCSEWHDHICYEYTTDYWYWYFTDRTPTPPR